WIRVGKGKNVIEDIQVEAPEVILSSSTLPLFSSVQLEPEGADCTDFTGEVQDDLASNQAVPANVAQAEVATVNAVIQETPLKGPSPLPLSPAAITTNQMNTESCKGDTFLPRSPLTRSQSLHKMDPIVMEGQGTQEDPLTPAVSRVPDPPPPGRSNSSKKKNKRSK
ncbi:hypothetical protein U1Q18_040676, partial [Sarracenia purpurea var. burkii]